MAWAVELQKLSSNQQIFVKRGINDLLYEGQLGTLHRNSVQINAIGSGMQPTSSWCASSSSTSPATNVSIDSFSTEHTLNNTDNTQYAGYLLPANFQYNAMLYINMQAKYFLVKLSAVN